MKLRFAGVVAAAVLINTLTQVDGFLKEAPKKQTNTRKSKKARWKRQIIWM